LAKKQRSKVEGKPIRQISVKLNSERLKKLKEIMDKAGVGKVKDGEFSSDKLRECIDKLHYHFVVADKSQIGIHKPKFLTTRESVTLAPDTRMCPMAEEKVSISKFCNEVCRERTPETWRKCPAR